MHELGADDEGKISFEKFLNKKVALRPEIHALKKKYSSRDTTDYIPSSSNNSLGMLHLLLKLLHVFIFFKTYVDCARKQENMTAGSLIAVLETWVQNRAHCNDWLTLLVAVQILETCCS